jgi:hypothetical protein
VVEVKYIFATGCGSSNAFIVHVTPKADVYRIQAENKIWLVPDLSSDYSIYDGHGVLTVGHIACSEFSLPFNNPVGFDWTPQWSNGVEGLEYSPVCHVVPPPRRSASSLRQGFRMHFCGAIRVQWLGKKTLKQVNDVEFHQGGDDEAAITRVRGRQGWSKFPSANCWMLRDNHSRSFRPLRSPGRWSRRRRPCLHQRLMATQLGYHRLLRCLWCRRCCC